MDVLNKNDTLFIERFLHAFKTLGGNELGFIDYEHFKRVLKDKNAAEVREITSIINAEHHVTNGKLDFVSLCLSILSTKAIFNNSVENGKVISSGSRVNTRTFTRNKASPEISNIVNSRLESNSNCEKAFNKSMKGLLFNINRDMRSYRYQLDILENSSVEICAKALSNKEETTPPLPIEVLIFQDSKNKVFVTSSTVINDDGYCAVKFFLKKGKYILIPVLLKWDHIGKSNSFDSLNLESLMHIEEESTVTLTSACEAALKVVFDSIDLDENGLLSQSEFDFFIQHTTGETAAEEWTTIEDNFQIQNHQLTFQGFLELYKMVIQTDPSDLMSILQQMGMNESLELENAKPFRLVVKAETSKFTLTPLPISSYSEVVEKVLRKIAVEQGSSRKVKNMNDLFLFNYRLPHRVTLVVQNQSHSKVIVHLDCSKSINCSSHRGSLEHTLEIPPRTNMIGHHLFPVELSENWSIDCVESLK